MNKKQVKQPRELTDKEQRIHQAIDLLTPREGDKSDGDKEEDDAIMLFARTRLDGSMHLCIMSEGSTMSMIKTLVDVAEQHPKIASAIREASKIIKRNNIPTEARRAHESFKDYALRRLRESDNPIAQMVADELRREDQDMQPGEEIKDFIIRSLRNRRTNPIVDTIIENLKHENRDNDNSGDGSRSEPADEGVSTDAGRTQG